MASSIINSDDGVISGTSGLKSTGGDDGVLNIQNNGATAVTVNASGNVGIGTTSPTAFSGFKTLELANSGGNAISLVTGTGVIAQTISSNSNSLVYMGSRSNHGLVITTNDAERARVTTDGYLRMASGSGGIQFNGDTAAANALDDYEEGTWAPSLGGNTTYSRQFGIYTKIGRQVIAYFDVQVSSIGTGTTSEFTGLPFTSVSGNSQGMGGCVGYIGSSANNIVSAYIRVDTNSTTAYIWSFTTAAATLSSTAIFGNGTRLTGTVTYATA